MTNNEAKQEIERQMIEQVPDLKKLGPELFASYLILTRKALDAFEEFQQQKINSLTEQNKILMEAVELVIMYGSSNLPEGKQNILEEARRKSKL